MIYSNSLSLMETQNQCLYLNQLNNIIIIYSPEVSNPFIFISSAPEYEKLYFIGPFFVTDL